LAAKLKKMTPQSVDQDLGNSAATSPGKVWRVGTLTYTTTGLIVLFCWLLWGDFAWSMKERSIFPVVQLLLKKFDASDMVAGLLMGSLPQGIAMILSPIVAYKSDRHRGRWGRRIPFLLIPTPIAALSMIGLAFSPMLGGRLHLALGMHSPGLNPSILILLGLFWTLFEFATITANSVFGGLVNDVVPHAVIGRFYGMFRALSLIAGMIFFFWLVGMAETYYRWIFFGVAALYGIGFTIMCMKVKEGEYPPPPPETPGNAGGFFSAAKVYFRDCFSHTYYIWFFAVVALSSTSFLAINLFSVFFAKSIHMDVRTYGKCIGLTYFISLGLSYALGSLVDRFHPLRVGLATQVLYGAATLWGGLFARDARTFAIALVAHGVLSGAWMTATAALGQMLLPKAEFAQFTSAAVIVTCLGTIIIGPALGGFLDYSQHVYRYTYLASFGLTVLGLGAGFVLHSKFMALGGPKNYFAPQ
jgi:MFS family permease